MTVINAPNANQHNPLGINNRDNVATNLEEQRFNAKRAGQVTPPKSTLAKRFKSGGLEEFQAAIEKDRDALKDNATALTQTKAAQMQKMHGFGSCTVEVAKVMKGTSDKSVLELASNYKTQNKGVILNRKEWDDLVTVRNGILDTIKPKATAAADEINHTAQAWTDQFNEWSELQYLEEQPTCVQELPGCMKEAVNSFSNGLCTMKGGNGSVDKLGGITETFEDALAKSTASRIQKLINKSKDLMGVQDTPGFIYYRLMEDDDIQHDANLIKERMKMPLTAPRELHKIAQKDSFRVILVFKDGEGDKREYVYHERRVIEGSDPKDVLLSIEGQKVLYASKYLCCAAVIGDFATFTKQVRETLGLPDGYVLDGVYEPAPKAVDPIA